ncbi:MAG TPA: hypothetical protein VMW42_05390, partial [Desulfatiglandales bacterium]|nr:hypothetical protein [Desulfatiglandales bacterium]
LLAFLCLVLILSGCASKERMPVTTLDTPEHHVFIGMKLLQSGKLKDGEREFRLAQELDKNYSPAYRELGVVSAYKGDFESAFKNMYQAKNLAKSNKEDALIYVGFMRLYTLQKDENWLENVKENFHKAINIDKDLLDAYFYMGIAYKEAYMLEEAAAAFKKVLEINKAFLDQTNYQLQLIQKIEKATPETLIGKKVALLEKVKKADVAALFIYELKLAELYKKFKPKKSEESSKTSYEISSIQGTPIPIDVQDHPLKADIKAVIELGVKGLGVLPDGRFVPDELITRAGYAEMLADIISTITNDLSLDNKYRGIASPFADVKNNISYFNAIMVCTNRGIIKPKSNIRQTFFSPMGSVSGVDALLAIRKLKEDLKLF